MKSLPFLTLLALCVLALPARANEMNIAKVANSSGPGGKKFIDLTITTNAREKLDPSQIQLVVNFYLRTSPGGAIVPAAGLPVSRWTTPPVDWASGPETLQLECPAEKGAAYYGVVLGIYYKGKIQASYIIPGTLTDNLPDEVRPAKK